MPNTSPSPSLRQRVVPWLIGVFALWQLAFFPLANLMEFVPLRPSRYDVDPPIESTQRWGQFTRIERLQAAAEIFGSILAVWGQVTGQEQGWNMFTPEFPPYTVLPIAEFRFPDGTVDRVASRFEPPDTASPRPPLIHDREFNFEANMFMLAWLCHPQTLADQPEVWQQLPRRIRETESLLTRWLSWQARRYRVAHPDKPAPTEVVLLLRYLPIRPPDEDPRDWAGKPAFERPMARWLPAGPAEPGYLPLEGYDPVARRYVRLKEWQRP
jgi:hypothetical protein